MLVVGYGNPLRGDDGVAWVVARQLADRRPDLDVLVAHALTPDLASELAGARTVVFVDARAGDRPGRVHIALVQDEAGAPIGPHTVSPGALMHCARRLFARRPPTFLVTIEGDRFDFGESLSPEVERSIPQALAAIDGLDRVGVDRTA